MADPFDFDDAVPLSPTPPSRARRAFSVVIVALLIASMIFLAWVSGRGAIRMVPEEPSTPVPTLIVAGVPPHGSSP